MEHCENNRYFKKLLYSAKIILSNFVYWSFKIDTLYYWYMFLYKMLLSLTLKYSIYE